MASDELARLAAFAEQVKANPDDWRKAGAATTYCDTGSKVTLPFTQVEAYMRTAREAVEHVRELVLSVEAVITYGDRAINTQAAQRARAAREFLRRLDEGQS